MSEYNSYYINFWPLQLLWGLFGRKGDDKERDWKGQEEREAATRVCAHERNEISLVIRCVLSPINN